MKVCGFFLVTALSLSATLDVVVADASHSIQHNEAQQVVLDLAVDEKLQDPATMDKNDGKTVVENVALYTTSRCNRVNEALRSLLESPSDKSSLVRLWEDTTLALHRNGEATACGRRSPTPTQPIPVVLRQSLEDVVMKDKSKDHSNKGNCRIAATWNKPILDKYETEAFLTRFYLRLLEIDAQETSNSTCSSQDKLSAEDLKKDADWYTSMGSYCDRGSGLTPQLSDYDELVRVLWKSPNEKKKIYSHLPCRFHTREGIRITSLPQIREYVQSIHESSKLATARELQECKSNSTEESGDDKSCIADAATDAADADGLSTPSTIATSATPSANTGELHFYAVSAGRVFMFAPHHVGEMFHLHHVAGKDGQPISLEVLSLEPRVFDVHNFFDLDEANDLVEKALAETSETHKLHRSTTGQAGTIFNKRTSENAWDTHGKTAQIIKRRCLTTLGFDEYMESHTDGLQILRYNTSKAYTQHMDYLEDVPTDGYDYNSAGIGGNRYATILLYMNDIPENGGGETVFSEAFPPHLPESERLSAGQAIQMIRSDPTLKGVVKVGSWEEGMTAKCRTRLSVTPRAARAVLFYSQFPDGREDLSSRHGGCPVLSKETSKWAANLWVFSAPRENFQGAPMKADWVEKNKKDTPKPLKAVFRNSGKVFKDPSLAIEVFYGDATSFGKLGPKDPPVQVNTYEGHVWNVKVNGATVATFTITAEPELQEYSI
jgi:2OG-Fe(II) oxygenase superfamily